MSELSYFSCGGDICPRNDGKPHEWDGPTRRTEDERTVTESATCSKCGLDHMSWCLMNAP